ncbi:SDR family NAD(P)-dependent oxidoreductase [Cellulomonas citrea]|uniref:SDR family NAD(P)-dependent oxidoreductase n=1 Tax=Cellulomonas citrea TaxID=1909423 RepID=UPI001F1F20F7|nr:SDR family NAD(P)-dependent oxidoreductase [Cellulomonas citrea]
MNPRPLALVTGASAGFGALFARRIAATGADLVLTARREDRLTALADELTAEFGVTAQVLTADLAEPGAPAGLVAELAERGLTVHALVNNAGFGTFGRFEAEDPARIAAEIAVNVTAPTLLTRLLLPDLLAAPAGFVVNVTSTAAYQPGPNIAVYSATKAYLRSFTEALWQETRTSRLRVLAIAPGPSYTEFFQAAGSEGFAVGQVVTAEQVVDLAMRELRRGAKRPSVIVGARNAAQAAAARFAPTTLTLAVADKALSTRGAE